MSEGAVAFPLCTSVDLVPDAAHERGVVAERIFDGHVVYAAAFLRHWCDRSWPGALVDGLLELSSNTTCPIARCGVRGDMADGASITRSLVDEALLPLGLLSL